MKRVLILLLLVSVLPVLSISAQGAPDAIDDALADLNERLGTSLTLNDFFWTWSQQTYDVVNLGCAEPVEPLEVEVGPGVGYEFIFTYQDQEYDYRVTAGREVVILCSITDLNDPDGVPTPSSVVGDEDDAPYSNPLCPTPPEGVTYQQTRLVAGTQGRVTPGLPLNMRSEASVDATIIAELPGETAFEVVLGPICTTDAYVWWQVNADGIVGWVAEGRQGEYFLEPLPGDNLDNLSTAITVDNATSLTEVSRLQGNFGWQIAFSPDDSSIVIPGATGSEGVMIFDTTNLSSGVSTVEGANLLTTVTFSGQTQPALLGSAIGAVRFWDTDPNAVIVERAFLLGHDAPVTAAAFSEDASTVASAGGMAFLREEREDNLHAIAVWDVESVSQRAGLRGHTDTVAGLAFTRVGTRLFSSSVDGTLRLWDVANATGEILFDAGVAINDMAYAENAGLIALGLANGDVVLVSVGDGGAVTGSVTLVAHGGAVNAVAFNPEGTLLFTGGEDTGINVWDTNAALNNADTMTLLATLSGHSNTITDLRVSNNGLVLVSLSADNTARLWAVIQSVG